MWLKVLEKALSLVRTDRRYAGETEEGLLHWVMSTGYSGLSPHSNTVHLLQVYAGNLMNSGRRGPKPDVIVNLIGGAIQPYVVNDKLTSFSVNDLAVKCFEYARDSNLQFVQNPERNATCLEQLQSIATTVGVPPELRKSTLAMVLDSVTEFGKLLTTRYRGEASGFHEGFRSIVEDRTPNLYPKQRLEEISQLPLVGVAVGLNFLKDTQAASFAPTDVNQARQAFTDIRSHHAGWLVKPDMHVLRLMLWISGRANDASVDAGKLVHLKDGAKHYARHTPFWTAAPAYRLSENQPTLIHGEWNCIEDLHYLAFQNQVAPLGLDRLLYLIGSGKYWQPLSGWAADQANRYSLITNANWSQ